MDNKTINDNLGYRRVNYPSVQEQLDMLWHMVDQGVIPGKESSVWYATIKQVKEDLPKATSLE